MWDTYARNYEIRSPKDITGSDLGIPSLSIQSFFEAKHGPQAWARIKRVPRADWMDYLRWYRSVADLPIENGVAVTDIDYDADGVTITAADGASFRSRLVVLATGMDGGGAWQSPPVLTDNLPGDRYNHTGDMFEHDRLNGQRIGVVGAGAAAFDIAVTALTHGAKVQLFMRRDTLPMIDVAREMEHGGGLDHAHELSDNTKWALSRFMSGLSQSPAEHHFLKAFDFPNFRMHMGAPWESAAIEDGDVVIGTPRGSFRFDHVFAATGVSVDMSRRPELAKIAAKTARWKDRFVPPADDPSPRRLQFPYLNRCYQFTEREPGTAPGIDRIYAFNALASMSMGGMSAVSISSHKFGVPRLVSGITGYLFAEQEDAVIPTLMNYRTLGIELPPHVRAALGMAPETVSLANAG